MIKRSLIFKEKEGLFMFKQSNNKIPKIQASGYNGSEPTRICPHCRQEKPLCDFGFRQMGNGEIRNQSWCKNCRSNA